MKSKFCFIVPLVLLAIPLQPAAQTPSSAEPSVTIVSFKITKDYYPMLDGKPSGMSADNGEIPMSDAEIFARNNTTNVRRGRTDTAAGMNDEKRSRGRLHSHLQIIDRAESVNLTIRNTSTKAMKALVWEFAFLRMEQGQLALRQTVTSQVELKPGKQKTLRQPLPPGASRCKVVSVQKEEGKTVVPEYVCGRGFADPSLLKEKPEPVAIKRIEFVDGSSWERQ